MIQPTLQSVLLEKYDIRDSLLAEGRFVGLVGGHAANLVCLGLTISCLYVAKVVLSGDVINYDVTSIIPHRVTSLSVKNAAKKIEVRSQYQPAQVYEMCSSDKEPEVWEKFTSAIADLYTYTLDNTWSSTSLHVPSSTPHATLQFLFSTAANDSTNYHQAISAPSRHSLKQIDNSYSTAQFTRNYFATYSAGYSLLIPTTTPTVTPSQKDVNNNNNNNSSSNNNNNNLLSLSSEFDMFDLSDVRFENFVNDAAEVREKDNVVGKGAESGLRGILKRVWSYLFW